MTARGRFLAAGSLLGAALVALVAPAFAGTQAPQLRAVGGRQGANAPRFPRFDEWFRRYREGRVLFVLRGGKAAAGVELDSFAPDSAFRRALQECQRTGGRAAAEHLLDLACFRFAEDPQVEAEKFAAAAPARVRDEAMSALAQLGEKEVAEYLAREVLLDRARMAPSKRAAAALALGRRREAGQALALYSAASDPVTEVRSAAIAAAVSVGDVRPTLLARWLSDPDPVIRLEALGGLTSALARKKDPAERESALLAASERLGDGDWRVRDRAAGLLLAFPSRASIAPLIALLESELARIASGTGRRRVLETAGEALVGITSVEIPANDSGRWKKWWEANRERFVVGDHAAGRARTQAESNYFSIPIRTDRMVFVIDISGSMNEPYGAPAPGTSAGSGGETTKIARVKQELARVVKGLAETDRFQIVAFSNQVQSAFPRLVPATKDNKRAAERFLAGLRAEGGTALWDALEIAFLFSGARGDEPGRDADTIFCLTDGEPTAGAIVEPAEILKAVSHVNKTACVRIHTLFAGPEGSAGSILLNELAHDHGGEFRRVAER